MDLHRFWDGVITSRSNLDTATKRSHGAPKPPGVSAEQLTELANTEFESWAKESFEIATNIAYRNDGRIGIPKTVLSTARWSAPYFILDGISKATDNMNGTTTKARAVAPVRTLKFGNLIGRGFGFLGTL
jgi:hypothetical protein